MSQSRALFGDFKPVLGHFKPPQATQNVRPEGAKKGEGGGGGGLQPALGARPTSGGTRQNMLYNGGLSGIKVGLKSRDFYRNMAYARQKYGIRTQYINTSPGIFSCIRAGANEYRRDMYTPRNNFPQVFG